MKKFELSEKKLRMCFVALRLSAESEDALFDSYSGCREPQDRIWAEEARASAKAYRKLRAELGEMLGIALKTPIEKEMENGELLTLDQIKEKI